MAWPGKVLMRKRFTSTHKGSEEASHTDIWRKRIHETRASHVLNLMFFSEK